VPNVCIIGGGPAGLAASIALSQCGFHATVIDRSTPPIDKACGEGLMPDSIAVLYALGIRIPDSAGFRFRGIRFSDAHSSVASDFPNGMGIGMRRVALHDLLIRRAVALDVNCMWGAKRIRFEGKQVRVDGTAIAADVIVAADGQSSATRASFGLHTVLRERRRYGFRRHYRIKPWSEYMELYWGPQCQIYITPIAADEICVVSISRSPKVRLDDALAHFPALGKRLAAVEPASREMGALSTSRKLRTVCENDIALIGDASGSVDAITGEGLCLSFKQALSLAAAVRSGDLRVYQAQHRLSRRRPELMSRLMLTLDKHSGFQRRALAALACCPAIFDSLLAVHVGAGSFVDLISWRLVGFVRAFLEA
jgi:menaquinone-9 beta-reductase